MVTSSNIAPRTESVESLGAILPRCLEQRGIAVPEALRGSDIDPVEHPVRPAIQAEPAKRGRQRGVRVSGAKAS